MKCIWHVNYIYNDVLVRHLLLMLWWEASVVRYSNYTIYWNKRAFNLPLTSSTRFHSIWCSLKPHHLLQGLVLSHYLKRLIQYIYISRPMMYLSIWYQPTNCWTYIVVIVVGKIALIVNAVIRLTYI